MNDSRITKKKKELKKTGSWTHTQMGEWPFRIKKKRKKKLLRGGGGRNSQNPRSKKIGEEWGFYRCERGTWPSGQLEEWSTNRE